MTVNRGEITIIGPNSAGKSTLMQLILDLIAPDSGIIERSDDLVIGYMPQNTCRPYPANLNRQILTTNKYFHEDCHKALDLVDIPEAKNTPFHKLSGGEMQRFTSSQGYFVPTNLLVLDEPVQVWSLWSK